MVKEDILFDRIKGIVSDVLRNEGLEFVDMSYKREGPANVLRVLADREGGITIDECARMNEAIGEALDMEDVISEKYILEVSSPGLDRPFKTKKDFLRLKGKRILVHVYEPIEGKREFSGVLEAVEEDGITVSEKNAKAVKLPLTKISKATFDYKSLI